MADLILACGRRRAGAGDEAASGISRDLLRRAALLLAPAGTEPHPPHVVEAGGVLVAMANPQPGGGESAVADGCGGVYVGVMYEAAPRWRQIGTEAPDGTYALMRWDAGSVELLTDVCASRTLWFVSTEDVFLASTSQRALVALLGSYEHEPEAVAWMLSSGTLGPEVSWDTRLQRVAPDARLTFDRAGWSASEHLRPARFEPCQGDRAAHLARVRSALVASCAAFTPDLDRWPLALSGGVDSRVLLAAFAQLGRRPRCITWTTREALRDPLSDASIARGVARRLKAEHEIILLDPWPGGADEAISRFVAADEGRNDDIAAYLDGMEMWRRLLTAGVAGVLRGDECYGVTWNPPAHELTRKIVVGPVAGDYPEGYAIRDLPLAPQHVPERLMPAPDEDRVRYRVRMIQQGYIACAASGLNGLKARYVEVANPHLSRRVIDSVHLLPTELLRGKTAMVALARTATPLTMAARSGSTPSAGEFMASEEVAAILVRELTDPGIERVLPGEGALRVLAALVASAPEDPSLSARAKRMVKKAGIVLPTSLLQRVKPPQREVRLPAPRLALRVLLASRTMRRLEEDARALRG